MKKERIQRQRLIGSRRETIEGLCFVLPGLIYMLAMIGYPILYNIVLSFQDVSVFNIKAGQDRPFIGVENYRLIFANDTMLPALSNTFLYTIVCLIVQFVFGLLLALLYNKNFALAKPLRGFLVVSWMMPVTVTALLYKYMLSPDVGIIDYILMNIGIIDQPVGWLLNQKTAIWGPIIANSWVGIPFDMLLLSAGLAAVPQDVYESAAIDGANVWQKFTRITLPLLRPAIMSVLVLGFVNTFKVFDLIFVMTGGGPVNAPEVLSTFAYKQSFGYYYFGQGAAIANVLMAILFVVAFIYLILIKKGDEM